MDEQRRHWTEWNSWVKTRENQSIGRRQMAEVERWLTRTGRTDLDILEVGCGSGWFTPHLTRFGTVTATDLAVVEGPQRYPGVTFIEGDFMDLDFGRFHVIVTLEVLSHVPDQAAFMAKLASHLDLSGLLMLATQNRPVLEHFNDIDPPASGQLRRWVDRSELRRLAEPHFAIHELFTATPVADRGVMRLVNAKRWNRAIGNRLDPLKERLGLGWTLMMLAEAR